MCSFNINVYTCISLADKTIYKKSQKHKFYVTTAVECHYYITGIRFS